MPKLAGAAKRSLLGRFLRHTDTRASSCAKSILVIPITEWFEIEAPEFLACSFMNHRDCS